MVVWIVQTGEPIPGDNLKLRPMRAMNLSEAILADGHEVVLFTPLFFHQTKHFRDINNFQRNKSQRLRIVFLSSSGYQKNISLKRFWDHFQLGADLKNKMESETTAPDFVIIGFPPIETALVAAMYAKKNKVPFSVDVKDLWPDIFVQLFPKILRPIASFLLLPYFIAKNWTLKNANCISSISEAFLQSLTTKRPESSEQLLLVAPLASALNIERNIIKVSKIQKNKVLFIGSHSDAFDFTTVCRAASILKENGISVHIFGEGTKSTEWKSLAKGHDNLIFHGFQPFQLIMENIASAICTIAPYKDRFDFLLSVPNKITDSLQMGLPIVRPLGGEVKKLIENRSVGMMYDQENDSQLAYNIIKLKEDKRYRDKLTKNCFLTYDQLYDSEKIMANYLEKIKILTGTDDWKDSKK